MEPAPLSEAQATAAFANHDLDGSGTINKEEMLKALAEIGIDAHTAESVLQGVHKDQIVTCSDFLVFAKLCQGPVSKTSSPSKTKKTGRPFRRTSGIRTAMLKLGVVTNNFFTKKLKTPKVNREEAHPGSVAISGSSSVHNQELDRLGRHNRKRISSPATPPAVTAERTVASTAVPSPEVFIEHEPLPVSRKHGRRGKKNFNTPSKLHSDSQYARNNPKSAVGRTLAESSDYAMSPVVTSQSGPFARASAVGGEFAPARAGPDYSRRRSSGRIGARFLAMHGASKEDDLSSADKDLAARASAARAAALAAATASAKSAQNPGDGEGVSNGMTTRMSNRQVLSMKEIAERLRQFNDLGGLPPDQQHEQESPTTRNKISDGVGWRIFGWAGKTNLGRRLHPRPHTMDSKAAENWSLAVESARKAVSPASASITDAATTDEKQVDAEVRSTTPEAQSENSPPRSFGELVASPRRKAGISGKAAPSTPRFLRQELFLSAQKKYKDAVPAGDGVLPHGGNRKLLGNDAQESYGSLLRTPSMIPRVRTSPRRRSLE